LLFHPTSHQHKQWLFDGGIQDPSGSAGLAALPVQPRRSLHVVVNRQLLPRCMDSWTRVVPPSEYGAVREELVTVRLNNPPSLLLGDASFRQLEEAVLVTATAMLAALDRPLKQGREEGHWILEVDVGWGRHGGPNAAAAARSRL